MEHGYHRLALIARAAERPELDEVVLAAVKDAYVEEDAVAAGRQLGNRVLHDHQHVPQSAGGILAGISNGDEIRVRVAVKPIPSISMDQQTINSRNEPVTISIKGRHDISAIPRINPVCEAMVKLVLADHLLRHKALL